MMCLQLVALFAGRHLSIRRRMGEAEFALPVTLRSVLLGRLAALWLTFFGTFFAGSLVWLIVMAQGAEFGDYGWCMVRAFAASGAAVLALGCYRPSRPVLSLWESIPLTTVSCLIWLSSAYFLHEIPNAVYLVALAGQLVFLALSVPAAAPAEDPRAVRSVEWSPGLSFLTRPSELPVRLFGVLNWTILRSTLLRPHVLVSVLMIMLYAWWTQSDFLVLFIFLALLPFNAVRMSLNVLHGLDPLPLRRERVLRFAALGSLVIMVLGAAAGSRASREFHGFEILSSTIELDRCSEESFGQEHEFYTHVKVPPQLWRIGRALEDTQITAPFGESVRVVAHPLYPGSKTFIYNPYDIGPDSSIRFVAWQVSRAIGAVQGQEKELETEIMSLLDDPDETISVDRLRSQDLEAFNGRLISTDLLAPGRPHSPNQLGFITAAVVLLWLLTLAIVLRPNTPSARPRGWLEQLPKGSGAVLISVPIILLLTGAATGDRSVIPVIMAQVQAWMNAWLGSSPALWGALVAVLAATGYALLAWRIQRIEIPSLAVHGWTKKPMSIY